MIVDQSEPLAPQAICQRSIFWIVDRNKVRAPDGAERPRGVEAEHLATKISLEFIAAEARPPPRRKKNAGNGHRNPSFITRTIPAAMDRAISGALIALMLTPAGPSMRVS